MLDFGPSWDKKWSQTHLGVKGRLRTIYCISEHGSNAVKVGIAGSVRARIGSMQAHNPRKLNLEWSAPGYGWHESAIHVIGRPIQIRGEWFDDDGGVLTKMLRGCDNSMHDLEEAIAVAMERLTGQQLPRRLFSFKGSTE